MVRYKWVKKFYAYLDRRYHKVCHLLGKGNPVWVLYLDIAKFHEVELTYGDDTCKRIIEELELEIENTLKEQRHLFLLSLVERKGGDDFVVFFIPNEDTPWEITEIVANWLQPLEARLNARLWIKEPIALRSGIVLCSNQVGRSPNYLLHSAVKEALLLNKSEPDPLYFARRSEFARLFRDPEKYLKSAFQPILEVKSGKIFGFEALARMTESTAFKNIGDLFPFAEKIGQLYPLETLCRRKAIISSSNVLKKKEMLFLNIEPIVLQDPDFATGQTRKLLIEQGIDPSNVVLEITERSAIKDFGTFRQALAHYRSQGYKIALDDVGAGYSSLQSIAELHPDFLKIDRSLISGVNADPIKWALLDTFVSFSKRIGCKVLAEGVETEEELRTVICLGVDYIQGFHLARPSFDRAVINPSALEVLKNERRIRSNEDYTILSLVEPLPLFGVSTLVSTVETYFRNQPNQWIIGVVDGERIVGVIQKDKLYAALGTRYGVSLYSEKNLSVLMDTTPLIVEDTTPIEVVSSVAMERTNGQLYDGIIVVNHKKPVGFVSVADLMKAMADRQIQIARGANPLTGLPGNLRIEQELRNRIEQNFDFGLIYADLNKFKYYNDQFGFEQGDMAIKTLSDVLIKTVHKLDNEAFIGHIGGDDFVIMLQLDNLESCCIEVLNEFNKSVQNLMGADNLSIALACLQVQSHIYSNPFMIAEKTAKIKKKVKKVKGNNYLIVS